MKKKIFVRAPVLTATGYGEQARFALRALRSREDLFDIYVQPTPWGQSGWKWEDSEEREWLDARIGETQVLLQQKKLQPDISLQITIPNEFKKLCPINIGFTAGIETDRVSPVWLEKGNEMDKILVVSEHAKSTYEGTVAVLSMGAQYKLTTDVDVVHETTPMSEAETIAGFNPRHDFNFLVVSQFGPRKNFNNTIKWFVEKFHDEEIGLILKTSMKGSSRIDLEHTEKRLSNVLAAFPNRKCSVSLLHGDLSEGQMRALYEHGKVKALVNIAHGEGFGLPLFEAARCALPIVTIPWSGQMDFLSHDGKNYFASVDHDLAPVGQDAVWKGVIEENSNWAYAKENSYKMALQMVHEKWEDYRSQAVELQGIINTKFQEEKLYAGFCDAILNMNSEVEIDEWGVTTT
jgi:glycosyltransferase involved in cell wall biosynthesis